MYICLPDFLVGAPGPGRYFYFNDLPPPTLFKMVANLDHMVIQKSYWPRRPPLNLAARPAHPCCPSFSPSPPFLLTLAALPSHPRRPSFSPSPPFLLTLTALPSHPRRPFFSPSPPFLLTLAALPSHSRRPSFCLWGASLSFFFSPLFSCRLPHNLPLLYPCLLHPLPFDNPLPFDTPPPPPL
ncbi:unnamed protein product [Closterium sp. Naga37s-1]|nr:unnamed protein product [Closterium sp. Naga37s-1]